jgi:hypothetical protein
MQLAGAVVHLLRKGLIREPPVPSKGVRPLPFSLRKQLTLRFHIENILRPNANKLKLNFKPRNPPINLQSPLHCHPLSLRKKKIKKKPPQTHAHHYAVEI